MDNNQKIEFLLKLERRDKRRKILIAVLIIATIGGGMVFSQYMNLS